MGIIVGSGSFTRYRVEGALPDDYMEEFPKRIARYAFRPLEETSLQERTAGWVDILDMFDSSFKTMEYLREPWLAMGWRVDVRRVPKNALIQNFREAEEKIKAEEGIEFIPKNRRIEIREAVKARLFKRAIPDSNSYDTIWDLRSNVLIFGATKSKLCDEFAEFFKNCFELQLKAVYPAGLAAMALEDENLQTELLDGHRYSIGREPV